MTLPATIGTRSALVTEYALAVDGALRNALQTVAGGEWDGVEAVTKKDVLEALRAVFDQPVPEPTDRAADVRTPAYVAVTAICPNCHQTALLSVSISSTLLMEAGTGELKLHAKSKGKIHVCGQITLADGVAEGQETAFELGDIVSEADAVTDEERAALDATDEPIDPPEDGTLA